MSKPTCPKGHPNIPENRYPRYDKPGSYETRCKLCSLERSADWQRRNRDRRNELKRRNRVRHPHKSPTLNDHLRRFWAYVDKGATEDSCWTWTGDVSRSKKRGNGGYGRFRVANKTVPSHRWIYEQTNGPIADPALTCDHLCRNRRCVRPDHIEIVTSAENIKRGLAARSQATHCRRGHEYTTETTKVYYGHRYCQICQSINAAKRLAEQREMRGTKTTCRRGHSLIPENRVQRKDGHGDRCRLCQNEASRRYLERLRKE